MNKFLLTSVMLITGAFVFTSKLFASSITVTGNISSSTTWLADTIKITGNLTVNNGVTLTINPGRRVEMQGNFSFIVQGRVLANGTITDSIVFSSSASAIRWKGIEFNTVALTNDTSIFRYCKVERSGKNSGDGGVFYLWECRKIIIDHCYFSAPVLSNGDGGVIYCYNSNPVITNNTFANADISGHGGAIAVLSSNLSLVTGSNPIIHDNLITGCTAGGHGGAIYADDNGIKFSIRNNTIINNTGANGGGISLYDSKPDIIRNIISHNSSDLNFGGGIYCGNSDPLIDSNIIDTNTAYSSSFSSYGGGIGCTFASFPKIRNNKIRGNKSKSGGAIYLAQGSSTTILKNEIRFNEGNSIIDINLGDPGFGSSANATLDSNVISNNNAIFFGMVFGYFSSTITVKNNEIVNNTGKGLVSESNLMTITNNIISGNTHNAVECARCKVEDNTIVNNLGIGISVPTTSRTGDATITKNNITHNANGGLALYHEAIVSNNVIANNGSHGVRIESSNSKLINNRISNNSATQGGGIFCLNSNPKITGNLINNNSASAEGGGIYLNDDPSNPVLVNNTIVNNFATNKGGGIYSKAQSLINVYNTVITGNETGGGANQLYTHYDNYDLNFIHCNIQGGSAAFDLNFGFYSGTYTNNLDTTSGFINPTAGAGATYDVALASVWQPDTSSLLYNAGRPDTSGLMLPSEDLAGIGRILADTIDIGAYEILPPLGFLSLSADTSYCSGDTLLLMAKVNHPSVNYQWLYQGVAIPGATDSLLEIANITISDSGNYQCVAWDITDTNTSNPVHILVNALPVLSSLGNDTAFCSGNQLTLSMTGFASVNWNNGLSTLDSLIISATGNYFAHVTDTNGCSAQSDTFALTVNPLPVANLGNDTSICQGDSLLLIAGLTGNTYSWHDALSASSRYVKTAGTSYVTVTDAHNCMASDTIVVGINLLPTVNLGNDTSICQGDSVLRIAGPSSNNYLWSNSSTDSSLYIKTGGITYVTVTDGNGCKNTDTVAVTLKAVPTAYLGLDSAFCQGDSVLLIAGTSVNTYLWNTTATDTSIHVKTGGTFFVTVTAPNGCQNSDTINFILHSLPVVNLSPFADLCEDAAVLPLSGGTPAGGNYSGPGVGAGSFNPLTAGPGVHPINYTYTDANNCVDSALQTLTVHALPAAPKLGNDTTLCFGDSITLNAGTYATYLWSTTEISASILVKTAGSFDVLVADINGCEARDTIEVDIFNPVIRGVVSQSNSSALPNTKILLIRFNPSDSSLTAIDSAVTAADGSYAFLTAEDNLYIKALPDSATYPNEMPTYFDTAVVFQDAKAVTANLCDTNTRNFSTRSGSNPGGPGFIGGLISQGANKAGNVGDPVSGLTVILMKDGQPNGYKVTNADGYFLFEQIAEGTYSIWVDHPFIDNDAAPEITIATGELRKDSLLFYLHSDYLELYGAVGINTLAAALPVKVYPNPNNGMFHIVAPEVLSKATIQVFNQLGREIISTGNVAINNPFPLDLSAQAKGVYLVKITSGEGVAVKRVVIE